MEEKLRPFSFLHQGRFLNWHRASSRDLMARNDILWRCVPVYHSYNNESRCGDWHPGAHHPQFPGRLGFSVPTRKGRQTSAVCGIGTHRRPAQCDKWHTLGSGQQNYEAFLQIPTRTSIGGLDPPKSPALLRPQTSRPANSVLTENSCEGINNLIQLSLKYCAANYFKRLIKVIHIYI